MHRGLSTALFLISLALFQSSARAQTDGGASTPDDTKYELGFHLGNLLPNQIPGITEIMGLGGVRAGARIAPLTFAEAGVITGNGSGAEWKNAHIDVRMDIPVGNLVGLAYVGGDAIYYRADAHTRLLFGGHVGGGLQTQLLDALWLRGDMKFGFSPGTSLYVGFGFEFRFSGK